MKYCLSKNIAVVFSSLLIFALVGIFDANAIGTNIGTDNKVRIESHPDKAKIFINGEFYGRTPLSLQLLTGTYQITLNKPNYQSYKKKIYVKNSNQTLHVRAELKQQQSTGGLSIHSTPAGADLYLNGEYMAKTLTTLKMHPGTYEFRLEKSGYETTQQQFKIEPNKTLTLRVSLEHARRYGTVVLESKPLGAGIFIDEQYYDVTPARISMQKGSVKIRFEKEGFQSATRTVKLSRDRETRLNIELEPIASYSLVKFTSEPKGAKVFIDNKFYEKTPFDVRLLTGKHKIKLEKQGYKTTEKVIQVQAAKNKITKNFRLQNNDRIDGTLRAYSSPEEAEVFLGDQSLGFTPLEAKLKPGRYKLVFRKPGYKPRTEAAIIASRQIQYIQATLEKSASKVGYGSISIDADQTAHVFINGDFAGKTPVYARLPAAEHQIEVRRKGYTTYRKTIAIKGGKKQKVFANLQAFGYQGPRPGHLEIKSNPAKAEVLIDGTYMGLTPIRTELTAGKHDVEIRFKEYESHHQQVQVAAGQNQNIEIKLNRESKKSRTKRIFKSLLESALNPQ